MRLIGATLGLVVLAACSSMSASGPAPAPAPAPSATAPQAAQATTQRIGGEVTAVNAAQITLRGADGVSSTFTFAPDAWVIKTRPIQASEIHAGDFVATANTNNADGSGTSTELRVFPPGMHLGEGSYPMQEPNTTMTNATVAQVTNVAGGRQLTVTYGANAGNNSAAGSRTITLPESVQVVQWYRVPASEIVVGAHLRGRAHTEASGAVADFVLIDNAAR